MYIVFYLHLIFLVDNNRHDTSTLGRNNKNKIKRLNQPNESIKKKKPGLVSTTKKIILNNNSSVNKCIDQRLMNVQQKPIVPILNNVISSSSSSGEIYLFYFLYLDLK